MLHFHWVSKLCHVYTEMLVAIVWNRIVLISAGFATSRACSFECRSPVRFASLQDILESEDFFVRRSEVNSAWTHMSSRHHPFFNPVLYGVVDDTSPLASVGFAAWYAIRATSQEIFGWILKFHTSVWSDACPVGHHHRWRESLNSTMSCWRLYQHGKFLLNNFVKWRTHPTRTALALIPDGSNRLTLGPTLSRVEISWNYCVFVVHHLYSFSEVTGIQKSSTEGPSGRVGKITVGHGIWFIVTEQIQIAVKDGIWFVVNESSFWQVCTQNQGYVRNRDEMRVGLKRCHLCLSNVKFIWCQCQQNVYHLDTIQMPSIWRRCNLPQKYTQRC